MKHIIFYSAILFLGAFVTSCGKYEEGPKFTLLSKKARMTNEWKFTKQESNGIDTTPNESEFSVTMTLKEDGTASVVMVVFGLPLNYSGEWAFSDDKEELILSDDTGTQNLEIIKLTNSELKVRQMQGNDEIVTTYTAQ